MRFEKSKKIIEDLKNIYAYEIHDFDLPLSQILLLIKSLILLMYKTYVMVKFSEIAEGEQLRVKLAFLFRLFNLILKKIMVDILDSLLLIVRIKRKEIRHYLEGLKEVLNQIQLKLL